MPRERVIGRHEGLRLADPARAAPRQTGVRRRVEVFALDRGADERMRDRDPFGLSGVAARVGSEAADAVEAGDAAFDPVGGGFVVRRDDALVGNGTRPLCGVLSRSGPAPPFLTMNRDQPEVSRPFAAHLRRGPRALRPERGFRPQRCRRACCGRPHDRVFAMEDRVEAGRDLKGPRSASKGRGRHTGAKTRPEITDPKSPTRNHRPEITGPKSPA